MSRLHVVVVAAGSGSRFGGDIPKQYLPIDDECVLQHTVRSLAQHEEITAVTLVVNREDMLVQTLPFCLPVRLVYGGLTRHQSVSFGVQALMEAAPSDLVLIHDGARPCLSKEDLQKVIACAKDEPFGAMLATPVVDTLKRSSHGTHTDQTVPREGLWQAQTPQVYRFKFLQQALDYVHKQQKKQRRQIWRGLDAPSVMTDEAMAFEELQMPVALVQGSRANIKLTYSSDLPLVRAILAAS